MLDLSPAKWIWLPSQRTLPNTFVLFRKVITLNEVPKTATGWILADSRYRLFVNGQRVQWGPAPCDPRHAEADPLDLTPYLKAGENVIGVEVLFYGHGDGSWPFGKPGLIVQLDLDGTPVSTDSSWSCWVDRAHAPGLPKRSFLRALQEQFDARLHPFGWSSTGFSAEGWLPCMELDLASDKPAFASYYHDYLYDSWGTQNQPCDIIKRSIPMMHETQVSAGNAAYAHQIHWNRDPADWFDFRVKDSFVASPVEPQMSFELAKGEAIALTFDLGDEAIGWPFFTIQAPAGTIVELMVHESHIPEDQPWLDTQFYAWSRFTCREGLNEFETFDFEAVKWIQLHIHAAEGTVEVSNVGLRQRQLPFAQPAQISTSEPELSKLIEASLNTLRNSCQETIVDGMGRERQQYSGDCGHQLHALYLAHGETKLPARYLRTYAQGQLHDGVFADSWPGTDRLMRLWQKNIGATEWGPLIDHSVGFCFDHYHYWMHTADLEPVRANWPKLLRFVDFLEGSLRFDGMLPVEDLGLNALWMDHDAYQKQSHKRLAFNLYAAAALRFALAPLAQEIDPTSHERLDALGELIQAATIEMFWDPTLRTLVNNRFEGEEPRMCDRSLATAIMYDMLEDPTPSINLLANPTPQLGLSYPANAIWRYWALAKAGRIQPVIDDLSTKWYGLRSVKENNTLQEAWTATPDTCSLMSHCPQAPLVMLYQGILGLKPLTPGYKTYEIQPQLGNIQSLTLQAHTPRGPIHLSVHPDSFTISGPSGVLVWQGQRYEIGEKAKYNR